MYSNDRKRTLSRREEHRFVRVFNDANVYGMREEFQCPQTQTASKHEERKCDSPHTNPSENGRVQVHLKTMMNRKRQAGNCLFKGWREGAINTRETKGSVLATSTKQSVLHQGRPDLVNNQIDFERKVHVWAWKSKRRQGWRDETGLNKTRNRTLEGPRFLRKFPRGHDASRDGVVFLFWNTMMEPTPLDPNRSPEHISNSNPRPFFKTAHPCLDLHSLLFQSSKESFVGLDGLPLHQCKCKGKTVQSTVC